MERERGVGGVCVCAGTCTHRHQRGLQPLPFCPSVKQVPFNQTTNPAFIVVKEMQNATPCDASIALSPKFPKLEHRRFALNIICLEIHVVTPHEFWVARRKQQIFKLSTRRSATR